MNLKARLDLEADILQDFAGFSHSTLNIDRKKVPDAFVKLKGRIYPSIVVEAGWSESERDLIADARLWLWGTDPPVEFVIVVEHVEEKVLHDDRPEDEKEERSFAEWEMEETLSNGQPIELTGSTADGQKLERAWQEQLLRLHHENKLMKPLLDPVQSTLHIYRRPRDNDDKTKIVRNSTDQGTECHDIYRGFDAEIYPDVSMRETKLRWMDIVGTPPKRVQWQRP
jgi:hypothetical protein